MRILHILDHSIPLQSGYTFRTRAILEQQRALGWETSHITSPKHYVAESLEEEIDSFHFYRSPRINGVRARLPIMNQFAVIDTLAKRLDEVVRKVQPDLLHAHSPALNGAAAVRIARRWGLPVVYEVRAFWEDAAVDHGTSRAGGLRYRLTQGLETWVLKQVGAVTTICEGLRSEIIARGIPSDKVTVIPNAVDPGKFQMGAEPDQTLATKLGFKGKQVLGFIGSFYAYEGLSLLLESFPIILASAPNTRLLLVGGGPQEHNLKALVRERGFDDKVIFTGRVPHAEVQRYYDLVDIFVYPRLPMRLTEIVTPLKPLEAMAQGKLVVASDVGGHKELIRAGETGELFKAGDPEALAHTVLNLLAQPEHWPQRKAAGRRFIEKERCWPASVARYETVYRGLC
ncbi:TIGR04063 family PEP-CTERM/XrtA system glycosyltransferase [Nitrosococcus wardiae]|uniref:Glycosyltransferase, exosortase A system-associated n=1 Tax=Nitrosococcus wardiae TaxID=1814290 RepID=A0A4P7C0U8_9GAMM|nr:TIGR04063 family PEP-CTERM/XrtA system glycosyltransferase [Nitrosococcus wardiae]QBQ54482.1 glycosyltransferase, exosortase A system-associated [Nitrosococcus wardiae]